MHELEPAAAAAITARLTARLAAAERALVARDKTIQALVNRAKDRAAKRHSNFEVLEETAALQQVVARKTLELEAQNRKLEQTTAALRETSGLLEVLLENTPAYIYFKDEQSRFVRFSKSLQSAFRQPEAAALTGKTDFDFFVEAHARETFADEQAILRAGEPIIGKTEKLQHADGRITWALTTKMPWRDKDGRLIGTFGISSDLTAIKAAEVKLEVAHQQLVETSRLAGMTEVATAVLHNVGNALNSVNVGANCVAEGLRKSRLPSLAKVVALLRQQEPALGDFFAGDPRGKQLPGYLDQLAGQLAREQTAALTELAGVQQNIEHIKAIVAMQQKFATGSGVKETVPAATLVEDALQLNLNSIEQSDVQVVKEFQPAPAVVVEKHKALQILVNLIRNAKQACDAANRDEKRLTLRILNDTGCVRISVGDNGVGIPPENLLRVFNHGFTTKPDGHGFALHSGANAAREMGGALSVHSAGAGHGATFTLELPATNLSSPS